MSDNESESSYNDGGDNDSSFAEEEVVAKPMGSSVKRKAAKRSPVVLELSNDDSSGSVPVKGTSKPIAVPAKRKALAKKKQTSKAPAKRKSIPKQKASPALESSDGFSSSSEENQVSAAKAKSVPAKRKPVPKKKVVLELSDDDDSDEAPKAAKKNPVVKRKASKPVAAAAEDSMSDDDSSYNSLELDVGAPKKKKSPKKIVLELSDDDSSDKKVAAKVKASAPGKVKRTTKEDGDDADDSSEIKPSRSPAKVAVAKKRKSVTKKVALEDYDAYDIVLPPNLVNASNGECTVLVQIDPDDVLDFTGAVGAVGRMEADDERGTYITDTKLTSGFSTRLCSRCARF